MRGVWTKNISLSQSGMQSIETPNTTLFKQENGLFDRTICALNGNDGAQKDRIEYTHVCTWSNARRRTMRVVAHGPYRAPSSGRNTLSVVSSVVHRLLCHKNQLIDYPTNGQNYKILRIRCSQTISEYS